jgi:hypothetical protein
MTAATQITGIPTNRMTADASSASAPDNRAPIWFWVIGVALVAYVALCTVQRNNALGADAWEHHRAVLALTRQLWKPGNPTYASDLPSVRYSPYAVLWAVVCRVTQVTPYTALSVAAVVNTILLVLGVCLLLRALGEAASAAAVLGVMVLLYGGVPAWANSYALADLPWHQVNPSAFSFALVLIAWSIFRQIALRPDRRPLRWLAVVVLMSLAMLDHGMTGAFGVLGLFVLAAVASAGSARLAMFSQAIGIAIAVGALCLCWPWYSFWTAVRWNHDTDFWFNPTFLTWELTQWAFPAAGCALFALPLIHRPAIRFGVVGGLLVIGAAIVAYVRHSPTLARFPLPGMIYLHIMAGIFAHHAGIFRPATWPARLKAMILPPPLASQAILEVIFVVVLLRCAVPQLNLIATQPWLARPYLVRLLHHGQDRQNRLPENLTRLLAGVHEHEVVLSDLQTSWLVPSINGRIVAAMHYELFVPDQKQRSLELTEFFTTADADRRDQIVRQYGVRWIVLNRQAIGTQTFNALLRPAAVVARIDDLVLMDASRWLADRTPSNTTRNDQGPSTRPY